MLRICYKQHRNINLLHRKLKIFYSLQPQVTLPTTEATRSHSATHTTNTLKKPPTHLVQLLYKLNYNLKMANMQSQYMQLHPMQSYTHCANRGNIVVFGCMYNTQKCFVIDLFLPSTQLLQQRYCKSSNQNQRHFLLCMCCVSALEICNASSQIKPCKIVLQQYC